MILLIYHHFSPGAQQYVLYRFIAVNFHISASIGYVCHCTKKPSRGVWVCWRAGTFDEFEDSSVTTNGMLMGYITLFD